MDDQSRIVGAEAAVSAVLESPRRRFFSRRKKAPPPLTHCENCGAPLIGPFCGQCGQHAVDYRRSLWRVLIDAADSFLNWDTKFLSSIGVLLTRPWKLTNDFNAGRRARYVHPLRLYLLASIAFFLMARLINFDPSEAIKFDAKDRAEMDTALAKLAAPDSGLDEAERARVEAVRAKVEQANGPVTAKENKEMRSALGTLVGSSMKQQLKPKDRAKLDAALRRVMEPSPSPSPAEIAPGNTAAQPSDSPEIANPPQKEKEKGRIHFAANGNEQKNDFEKWMEGRIKDKVGENGTKSKLFLETLRSNIPTMMLCCVPLFAFVLKVLYFRKRRYYVEHLVYALHIHTLAYVGVVVTTLVAMALARWSETARTLICTFLGILLFMQIFISIRRVYGQGWFFTAMKFFLGGVAYLVILVTAVAATAFITLLT